MDKILSSQNFDFYKPELKELEILFVGNVANGFPAQSDDFIQEKIDLNKILIKHPDATILGRAKGLSNYPLINPGDLVIIDKAEEWHTDDLAICFVDGEFAAKWIKKVNDELFLIPFSKDFPTINLNKANNISIWGIITWILHKPNVRPRRLQ